MVSVSDFHKELTIEKKGRPMYHEALSKDWESIPKIQIETDEEICPTLKFEGMMKGSQEAVSLVTIEMEAKVVQDNQNTCQIQGFDVKTCLGIASWMSLLEY